ncbi:vWA domain-containing protein [Nitratifractor sp.]
MASQQKLQKARARLMMEAPYFGEIASGLRLAADEDLPTFRSEREALRYNPSWLAECSVAQIETVLAAAAMHRVLGHEERGVRRHDRLWQLATDYAVNAMLRANGFDLPELMRYDPRFQGMYAEEIYAELRQSMTIQESQEEGSEAPPPPQREDEHGREDRRHTQKGSGKSPSPEVSEMQEAAEELERARLERIFEKMRRREELPEGLERLVPRYFARRIDWREELRRYLGGLYKSAYRFSPPSLKHLYRGYALPSLHSEALEIVIAVDSSGSVDEEMLGDFFAEVESLMEQFDDYRIELLVADMKVRSHRSYGPGEILERKIEGGGATDFRPVFEWIERELLRPTLLLYFTDAAGSFPAEAPPYEVIWVLSREAEVPFGERIVLCRE